MRRVKRRYGGFVLPLTPQGTPIAWRAPFPPGLQKQLVSDSNKTGTTNNSQLESAAIVTATAQMLAHTTTHHNTFLCASDNTPAVSWIQRGSTSTNDATAALLLLLHHFSRDRVLTLKALHVPGKTNTIANFLSRSFHLSNDAVLDHLHTTTQQYWTLANPPTELASIMTSMRCNRGLPSESPHPEQQQTTTHGTYGIPSVTQSMSIPTCKTSLTPSRPYNYLPNDIGRAAWLPAGLKLALEQWRQPFMPWARRWPQWGFGTHASQLLAPSTSVYNNYLPAMNATTQAPTVKNQSPSMLSSTPQRLSPQTRATAHTPSPTCYSSPTIFSCDQANTPSPTTPFRVKHAHFFCDHRRLHWATATPRDWSDVTKVALEFDRQKNGVRGEMVGLAPSGHDRWCPVKILSKRVSALRQQGASADTPLYAYRNTTNQWAAVTPKDLTTHLRAAVIARNHIDQTQAITLSARSL
jgi:hypothetical protein